MKKVTLITILSSITLLLVIACTQQEANIGNDATAQASKDSLIKRGKYLVTIMACHDCHSPKVMGPHGPEPDTSRLLSGHPAKDPIGKIDTAALKSWMLFDPTVTAMAGPWGVSFSANLTSDETGIGNWTEQQFFKAIREGKYKGMDGGRMLLPPMPWPMYRNATDDDLRAIFTFLKSTKPISNVVPAPIPPDQMTKR